MARPSLSGLDSDDLAEMLDAEDEAVPPTEETPEEKKSKRITPPPIPRQS